MADDDIENTDGEIEFPMDDDADTEVDASNPLSDIVDLVVDGKASQAREAIYAALYGKVGDRIDELRPEVRSGMVPTDFGDEEPIDLEADVDDSQE